MENMGWSFEIEDGKIIVYGSPSTLQLADFIKNLSSIGFDSCHSGHPRALLILTRSKKLRSQSEIELEYKNELLKNRVNQLEEILKQNKQKEVQDFLDKVLKKAKESKEDAD
jgi:hypothetical protein